jgi:hypothetical protein
LVISFGDIVAIAVVMEDDDGDGDEGKDLRSVRGTGGEDEEDGVADADFREKLIIPMG